MAKAKKVVKKQAKTSAKKKAAPKKKKTQTLADVMEALSTDDAFTIKAEGFADKLSDENKVDLLERELFKTKRQRDTIVEDSGRMLDNISDMYEDAIDKNRRQYVDVLESVANANDYMAESNKIIAAAMASLING